MLFCRYSKVQKIPQTQKQIEDFLLKIKLITIMKNIWLFIRETETSYQEKEKRNFFKEKEKKKKKF